MSRGDVKTKENQKRKNENEENHQRKKVRHRDGYTVSRLEQWRLLQRDTIPEAYGRVLHDTRSDISPLTEPEARVWVEECANDKYEAIFGEVEE